MPRSTSNEQRHWQRLLRAWQTGPASRLEQARLYTSAFPENFGGWIALADALWTLARYGEAERALDRAERLIPRHLRVKIWEQRGLLFRDKNDLVQAAFWQRKALKAQRTTGHYIALGATLARQGRLNEALKQHRAAVKLATPGDHVDEAHLNAGLVLRALERYDEARKHLRRALDLTPGYALARRALRDVERAIGIKRRRTEDATSFRQAGSRNRGKVVPLN